MAARLGLIGFGEAGRAFAGSLRRDFEIYLTAYDHKYQTQSARLEDGQAAGVTLAASPKELAAAADMIFSVVTADQSHAAAVSLAPHLKPGQTLLDGNSVSPGTKKASAAVCAERGVDYVDMAIMAPIDPRGHRTPLLLSGAGRERIEAELNRCGFDFSWQGESVGDASVVKMLRSILIKGVESLLCECLTAAEGLGVDETILSTAGKTLGIEDINKLADYVLERASVHGRRRAAEMREVAKTLSELGLSSYMAQAIAEHQDMVADMDLPAVFGGSPPADRLRLAAAMRRKQRA